MGIAIKFVIKNILEKKVRTSLIVFSIMLSTALFFTSIAISGTIGNMLMEKMKQPSGSAEIIISPDRFSNIKNISTVAAQGYKDYTEYIVGAISQGATFRWNKDEFVNVTLLGMELNDIAAMNPISLIEPSQLTELGGDGIIISQTTAKKYSLSVGDLVVLNLQGQDKKYIIKGIVQQTGFFSNESQRFCAITSKYALSGLLNMRGKVNTIYIKMVKPDLKDVMIKTLKEEYQGSEVREPVSEADIEEQLSSISTTFLLLTIIIFLMSIFIIFSSFEVISMERLPVLGTLRSVGATSKITRLILLIESIGYGLIGGVLGCGIGIGILYVLSYISRPIGYNGIDSLNASINFQPSQMVAAFFISLILSVGSSMIPILKASKVPIKDILFSTNGNVREQKKLKLIIALIIFVGTVIIPQIIPDSMTGALNVICMVASVVCVVLLVPYLTNSFTKLFEKPYAFIFGNEGILAAKNLKNNRSMFNSISLLAIGISTLLVIYTLVLSVTQELEYVYENHKFDVWMWYTSADRKFINLIHEVDGVSDVYSDYQEENVQVIGNDKAIRKLQGIDSKTYLNYWGMKFEENSRELLNQLDGERSIIPSTTLKKRYGLNKGDIIKLKMTRGEVEYKVIGFLITPMYNGEYAIMADKYLKSDMVKQYYDNILIKTSEDPAIVEKRIHSKFNSISFVSTTVDEMKTQELSGTSRMTSLINGFAIMALLIGIFGVLNNNLISFIHRKQSLAVLRSIGMEKKQSVKVIFIEALTGGLIGGIFGIITSMILVLNIIGILNAMSRPMEFKFTVGQFLVPLLAGAVITMAASVGPALKSSKLNIIEAIKFE